MAQIILITAVASFIFAALSFSEKGFKAASIVVGLYYLLSLSGFPILVELEASQNLAGEFFCSILSLIITLISLSLYNTGKQIILLKVATVSAIFTCVHMLYIMTYIEPIRAASWYYAPLFDKTYWYYGELQIVLTLYMISLFWKSGIRGLYVGFDKARSYFNNVHSFGGGVNTSIRINNSVLVGSNKSNKKGVQ